MMNMKDFLETLKTKQGILNWLEGFDADDLTQIDEDVLIFLASAVEVFISKTTEENAKLRNCFEKLDKLLSMSTFEDKKILPILESFFEKLRESMKET